MRFELFRGQMLVRFVNRNFDPWNRVLHTFIVYRKRDAEDPESSCRQVFKCRQRCLGLSPFPFPNAGQIGTGSQVMCSK